MPELAFQILLIDVPVRMLAQKADDAAVGTADRLHFVLRGSVLHTASNAVVQTVNVNSDLSLHWHLQSCRMFYMQQLYIEHYMRKIFFVNRNPKIFQMAHIHRMIAVKAGKNGSICGCGSDI